MTTSGAIAIADNTVIDEKINKKIFFMLYDIRISETIFVQDTKKNNNKKSICEKDPNAFLLWTQQGLNL